MPWSPPVPFAPGVNTVRTPILNGAGWSFSNLIRFRDGLPEKNGGWARISDTALVGTARGMNVWADLTGLPYAAFGTEQRLEVLSTAGITDITPLRDTNNPAVDFSTVINTPTVTVVDAGLGSAAVGDWVNLVIPVSVGGIVVSGLVQITALPTATSFSFTWTSNATATVNNGGAVPTYTFTNASATVLVTLAAHGLTVDNTWTNQVALTAHGVTIGAYTDYSIALVVSANTFNIVATVATSAGTTAENGAAPRLEYLVATGYATATLVIGFGAGLFSAGFYGVSGSGSAYTIIRQWFMDRWGQDLTANYPRSPIYIWVPPVAGGNRALAIDTTNFPSATSPPSTVNVSFVMMPEQILVALGCDPNGGGNQDPNLVRWTDVGDFTQWAATATNQAGSFRIPTGSRLVGGITGQTFGLIWTDEDLYVFNYIGFPLVFGFNRVAGGAGLISGRCRGIAGSVIYWVSNNAIYMFDGASAQVVPCPVWDNMFQNLDRVQIDKCHMAVNSWFQEIVIYFPSLSGDGEVDSYIRYNWRDKVWDYGDSSELFARTCWHDTNELGPPIGVDLDAIIQQHEIATDADGQQMMEYVQSGYYAIDNGWLFTQIDKFITDFKWNNSTASLMYWILTIDYPTDTPVSYGPFTATPSGPPFETINAAGRMVAVRFGFSNVGGWWRLGNTRHLFAPDGQL